MSVNEVITEEFNQIELIKEQLPTSYEKQKEVMREPLSIISKTVIDTDTINNRFADLVSEKLSKSDFKYFGLAVDDFETMFVSDKGDSFYFKDDHYRNRVSLEYKNNDSDYIVRLERRNNDILLTRAIIFDDDHKRVTQSEFYKKDGRFIQIRYEDSYIEEVDGVKLTEEEEYIYKTNTNEMIKLYRLVSECNEDSVVSEKKRILTIGEYIADDGLIHIINRKNDIEDIKTATTAAYKRLVNRKN